MLAAPFLASAQPFSINWFTIDGGGGASTNGTYRLTGTIGQPDAGTMSGGGFTLQGGFWGVVAAVQTPGAPTLSVERSNAVVVVSWPKPAAGFVLQYTPTLLSPTNTVWTPIPGPYPTNQTQFRYVESSPAGNRFYRLEKP